jgi:hypothetical protein
VQSALFRMVSPGNRAADEVNHRAHRFPCGQISDM